MEALDLFNSENTDIDTALQVLQQDQVKGSWFSRFQKVESEPTSTEEIIIKLSDNLRGPMASLQGLSELIDTQQADVNEDYMVMLKQLTRMQEAILRSLDDITFDAQSTVSISQFDVKAEIEEILEKAVGEYPEMGEIHTPVYEMSSGDLFFSDIDRFRKVLSQLLSNAVKFQREYEDEKMIATSIELTSDKVLLTIKDNGTGISREHQPKVFNAFYRGTTNFHGAGLGMFVTKKMVESMGGNITFVSQQGVGTTIYVELPNLI